MFSGEKFDPENDPEPVLKTIRALLDTQSANGAAKQSRGGGNLIRPPSFPPPPPPSCQLDGLEIDLDVTEIRPAMAEEEDVSDLDPPLPPEAATLTNYPDLVAEAFSSIKNESPEPREASDVSRRLESALLLAVLVGSILLMYKYPPPEY